MKYAIAMILALLPGAAFAQQQPSPAPHPTVTVESQLRAIITVLTNEKMGLERQAQQGLIDLEETRAEMQAVVKERDALKAKYEPVVSVAPKP